MTYNEYYSAREIVIKLPTPKSKAYELVKKVISEKWEVKQIIEEIPPDVFWAILYDKEEDINYEVSIDLSESSGKVSVHVVVDTLVTVIRGYIIYALSLLTIILLAIIINAYELFLYVLLPLSLVGFFFISLQSNIGWSVRFINTFMRELRKRISSI